MRGLEAELVHQTGDVIRPNLHVVVLERAFRTAIAALVIVDDVEVLVQHWRRGGEVVVAKARAMDLHDRHTLPALLNPEVDPVDLDDVCHSPISLFLPLTHSGRGCVSCRQW